MRVGHGMDNKGNVIIHVGPFLILISKDGKWTAILPSPVINDR